MRVPSGGEVCMRGARVAMKSWGKTAMAGCNSNKYQRTHARLRQPEGSRQCGPHTCPDQLGQHAAIARSRRGRRGPARARAGAHAAGGSCGGPCEGRARCAGARAADRVPGDVQVRARARRRRHVAGGGREPACQPGARGRRGRRPPALPAGRRRRAAAARRALARRRAGRARVCAAHAAQRGRGRVRGPEAARGRVRRGWSGPHPDPADLFVQPCGQHGVHS